MRQFTFTLNVGRGGSTGGSSARAKPALVTVNSTKFKQTRPINSCLQLFNLITLCTSAFALGIFYTTFARAKDDFLDVHKSTFSHPCAIATPSTVQLKTALGVYSSSSVLIPVAEEIASERARSSLCFSSTVYGALAAILRNQSIHQVADEGSDPSTYGTAEASLLASVCGVDRDGDGRYGDVRQRIATSYVLANPAFRRLETGCMGSNHPFPTDGSCTASMLVAEQLAHASMDPSIAGLGSLPWTGTMLYRVLALGVVAEHDRRLNEGRCFQNKRGLGAMDLCNSIYVINADAPPSPPRRPRLDSGLTGSTGGE